MAGVRSLTHGPSIEIFTRGLYELSGDTMRMRRLISGVGLVTALIAGTSLLPNVARATSISVANPSFEILPPGGLPYTGCGAGCSYSIDEIPGWSTTAPGNSGQFQPGYPLNSLYYNTNVPDGLTVGWVSGGSLYQLVVPSAVLGDYYTLTVDVGYRKDMVDDGKVGIQLGTNFLSGAFVAVDGGPQLTGVFVPYSATLHVTAADAGDPLYVVLYNSSGQGTMIKFKYRFPPRRCPRPGRC